MTDLKKCDFCGKLSPDERGRHIANKWYEIYKSDSSKRDRIEGWPFRHCCVGCWEKFLEATG